MYKYDWLRAKEINHTFILKLLLSSPIIISSKWVNLWLGIPQTPFHSLLVANLPPRMWREKHLLGFTLSLLPNLLYVGVLANLSNLWWVSALPPTRSDLICPFFVEFEAREVVFGAGEGWLISGVISSSPRLQFSCRLGLHNPPVIAYATEEHFSHFLSCFRWNLAAISPKKLLTPMIVCEAAH